MSCQGEFQISFYYTLFYLLQKLFHIKWQIYVTVLKFQEESCIRETLNLLTDADRSTDTYFFSSSVSQYFFLEGGPKIFFVGVHDFFSLHVVNNFLQSLFNRPGVAGAVL